MTLANRFDGYIWFTVQIDMNINPHLPSEYINNLENPMEIIHEAERAAEKDIWSLMQYTENLRRQYGKEPHSMEILLKKLYVRRMAADIGITKIYASGKMVFMKTVMNKQVFKLITDSVVSDVHRNSLVFEGDQIKVITYPYHHLLFRFDIMLVWKTKPAISFQFLSTSFLIISVFPQFSHMSSEFLVFLVLQAELLLELPREQLLNWIFQCLAELHASLPSLIKY